MDDTPWLLKDTTFSCVFPPGWEPDDALVRRIREFDPKFVPVWMTKTYIDPGGSEVTYGFYVIGRWEQTEIEAHSDPETDRMPLKLERPKDFPFHGGVVYDQRTWSHAWPQGSVGALLGLPEVFRPFDDRLYEFMREAHKVFMGDHTRNYANAVKRTIQARREMELEELARLEDEAMRRNREEMPAQVVQDIIDGHVIPDEYTPQEYVQAEQIFGGEQ
jgi:hypothetical protein